MLARTVLLGLLACLSTNAVRARQATRSEIALQNYNKRATPLKARASPASCASGLQDSQGSCCATTTTQSTTNAATCCSENVYQMQTCGSNACCEGGQSQILSIPGQDENGNQGFRNQCCPAGTVVTDNRMATGSCAPGMRKRDSRVLQLSKRGLQDPLRQMHFREGTWRTQLTPHLVADLFVNDWQMSYNGHTFIDWPARQATSGGRLAYLAKFLPESVLWRGTTDYLARARANGEEFIAIPYSDDYEIALEDVPKLYGAILEHPNFIGSIEINGIEYSPTLMKEIFSHSHNWNATIHDPEFLTESPGLLSL